MTVHAVRYARYALAALAAAAVITVTILAWARPGRPPAPSFPPLHPAAAPAGWPRAVLPGGTAVLSYPPSLRQIRLPGPGPDQRQRHRRRRPRRQLGPGIPGAVPGSGRLPGPLSTPGERDRRTTRQTRYHLSLATTGSRHENPRPAKGYDND
jgi:hypothetical protein